MTDNANTPNLTIERTEPGIYVASNERGARVRIGKGGVRHSFTPGELLQLAVAACAAVSSEANLVHHLGEDFEATLTVDAVKNDAENRYDEIHTVFSPTCPASILRRRKGWWCASRSWWNACALSDGPLKTVRRPASRSRQSRAQSGASPDARNPNNPPTPGL